MADKIKTVEEVRTLLDGHRERGEKVVFANGCFDLLHVGHVRYLSAARALGDVLVLGLNGNRSVRQLKGTGRPVMSESDRAEVLEALECVDYLVVFDDLNVEGLLMALKPDIHAKGTDYTEDTVPEREVVLSYGGSIAITGDPKGRSSRDILKRIARGDRK